ncbi:LuxR C-terminal-related transcriptional regulator (plasmid) [Enterobacter sp. JS8-1]|uniref:helix-turn-helix transcriptional regulator n=1 Tax=Enterobacter sp. JS8-1 TaxID=3411633 RepID=UPI003B9F6301
MLKILINESDTMFRHGMKCFLRDLFWQIFRRKTEFIIDYTPGNIADADVIILSMCNGEGYTCFPELRARSKGIIIGLVDESQHHRSPFCFKDIVYITRRETLEMTRYKIFSTWNNWLVSKTIPQYINCRGCQHYTLSLQQRDILERIYKGNSIHEIAADMNVTYKTVMAHKYIVMKKFGLKNDYELCTLFGRMQERFRKLVS